MIWKALSKIALIGTERASLSEATLQALSQLGVDTDASPAQVLLEGAALYHQLQRAGFPLPQHEGALPLPPASGKMENRVSSNSARQLRLILEGRFQPALGEYLHLASRNSKSLPPEHWPTFFRLSIYTPALWEQLQGSLTDAQRWLLRQNPEWDSLADEPEIEYWPEAPIDKKCRMLRYLRRTRPQEAPVLLRSAWPEAQYTEKVSLLAELDKQLGPYDEPFLEECLDDSRKEVRTKAARLLMQLPESALANRLFERGRELLTLNEEGGISLQYPTELDDALKRDGIGSSKKKPSSRGRKAHWAYEILSKIPPRLWEEAFRKNTVDLLRLFSGSRHRELLTKAVANAAVLHDDHRWVEAIIRYWWRTADEEAWQGATGKLLIKQLPAPAFNEMTVQQLKQGQLYIEEKSLPAQMLLLGAHEWENRLTKLVLTGFQEWLSGAHSYYWNLWHYKRILQVASYRAHPELLDTYRQGWDTRSPVWPHWEKDVERFLRTLAFRKDMREELEKP